MRAGIYAGGVVGDPLWIAGMDAAGVVETAVPGGRLSVGDRVMAMVLPHGGRRGAQAEYAVTRESLAIPIPDGMSFHEAATLPMNGVTGHMAAIEMGLPPGATVAVTGGAGVLASYFIALARPRGWRVVADAAPADSAAVSSFGADLVIPRTSDFAGAARRAIPEGVDGVPDAARLGQPVQTALRDGGVYLEVRPAQGDSQDVHGRSAPGVPTVGGRDIRAALILAPRHAKAQDALHEIHELASQGRITPRVAGVRAPEDAHEVHREMQRGGLRGKLVFDFALSSDVTRPE